jgi:hypothetical protein
MAARCTLDAGAAVAVAGTAPRVLRRRLDWLRWLGRAGEHAVAGHPIHLRQNGHQRQSSLTASASPTGLSAPAGSVRPPWSDRAAADQAAYQTSHTISNGAAKVVIARTRSRTTEKLAAAFRVSSTGSEEEGCDVILVTPCQPALWFAAMQPMAPNLICCTSRRMKWRLYL